jgi:2-oxoglutarate dehydrogenase E2 component (dihydrolipoamide succinyltransferase)
VLVELETDKVMLEVPSPADGVLEEILHEAGEAVTADTVLGRVNESAASDGGGAAGTDNEETRSESQPAARTESASTTASKKKTATAKDAQTAQPEEATAGKMGPAARRLVEEHGLDPAAIAGSGKDGRITKDDVLKHIESGAAAKAEPAPQPTAPADDTASAAQQSQESKQPSGASSPSDLAERVGIAYGTGDRPEKRVPMTRLRARVAERLLQATQQTAMLTTFNEVDMKPVMDLRERYKESFEQTHGVRLGFMSFFVTAAAQALKRFPDINASIDGNDIVYHGYCDIGIAVASERGLVVPIMRDAETLTMADIERQIRDFGERAPKGRIGIEEMTGGTFTVTNGGVFGSLVSTPILNPPQSAILGMHKIQERPVAIDGEVAVRPMMYLALSYDHRIVDGKDAVQFLVEIKNHVEDPARLLLDL